MIRLARPLLGVEEEQAVVEVMRSGILAQGPRVAAFEKAFAAHCGTAESVAVSSGTAALHLALLAHGVGPGDEVVTTPFSFMSTVSMILAVGAVPVFVDIETDTFNIDPALVAAAVTPRTKAIMPVHLYGHPADMPSIQRIADDAGIVVIEDAAQAHGAEIGGRRVGSFATGCFSFYPTKNMTTGEGGMVTTNDTDLAERIRVLRNHGMRRRYYHDLLGYNFRMTDLNAAIGLVQLGKLDAWNRTRITNAERLTAALSNAVRCPVTRPGCRHVFHQYTVRISGDRDGIQAALNRAGVDSAVFYPVPLYRQTPLIERGLSGARCPNAETAAAEVLSLPVHAGLSDGEIDAVAAAVREAVTVHA